jgi:nucleotide-binding universal stress UspA family protein
MMVPTELDRPSDISLKFAVGLARHLKVKEIVLLHFMVSPHKHTSSDSLHDAATAGNLVSELNKSLKKKHKKIVEKHARYYSDNIVNIIPDVKFTDSLSGLNELMKEYNADILVCASNEKISFLEVLFGSFTEKMIRKIDYPMILLKGETPSADIKTIVLAVDVGEDNQSGIEGVVGFADQIQAQLHLVYVRTNSQANDAMMSLQELAKSKHLQNYSINVVNSKSLIDGLETFIYL